MKVNEFTDRRRSALGAYLRELTELKASGQTKLSPALSRGARSLKLDAWETNLLRQALAGDAIAKGHWSAILPEGLAFQSKVMAALEETREADSNDLMTDAAVGLALMDESQRAINQMILAGDVDKAKKLTSFRNKLGVTVSRLKERIGADGLTLAEVLAAELIEPFGEKGESSGTAAAAKEPSAADWSAPAAPAADSEPIMEAPDVPISDFAAALEAEDNSSRHADRSNPDASFAPLPTQPPRGGIQPLGLILGGVLLIACVLVLPRMLKEQAPVIEPHEIPALEAVLDTAARPPSLFLKVDPGAWNALSVADRRDYLERVGATIEPSGYTGVHVQATDGRTVAQWLKVGGARIFDTTKSRARR